MLTLPTRLISRFTAPGAGLAALAWVAILYVACPGAYHLIMSAMTKVTAPSPFADWEWMPTAIRCWAEGVDVYANNTCYTVWPNLAFNYSPLWLRFAFLRPLEPFTDAVGLAIAAIFFLSLATLPRPGSGRDQAIALLATLSCATFLAVERSNADLIVFLLVIGAVNLRRLPPSLRLAGYALIALAGLLKFYPFMALLIALRERARVFAAVAIVGAAALAALVLAYHDELSRMARNLPLASYFTLQIGSADLPVGLGVAIAKSLEALFHLNADAARTTGAMTSSALWPILAGSAAMTAWSLARRGGFAAVLSRAPALEIDSLIAGAALICGCFFAGQSVIYRGIFLLLTLPGLAALARGGTDRKIFNRTSAAIVFALWTPFLEWCVSIMTGTPRIPYGAVAYTQFPGFSANLLLWFANELAWWGIVTVLLAILIAFVANSDLSATVHRAIRRRTPVVAIMQRYNLLRREGKTLPRHHL